MDTHTHKDDINNQNIHVHNVNYQTKTMVPQ